VHFPRWILPYRTVSATITHRLGAMSAWSEMVKYEHNT
jgi:hypothetical protein